MVKRKMIPLFIIIKLSSTTCTGKSRECADENVNCETEYQKAHNIIEQAPMSSNGIPVRKVSFEMVEEYYNTTSALERPSELEEVVRTLHQSLTWKKRRDRSTRKKSSAIYGSNPSIKTEVADLQETNKVRILTLR